MVQDDKRGAEIATAYGIAMILVGIYPVLQKIDVIGILCYNRL